MSSALRKRTRNNAEDYKIAIFCVLDVELAAARGMLDTIHDDLPSACGNYAYVLGEVHHHNVVIAILPATGNNDSGVVAVQLRADFPALEYGLLVGVGGGVPGRGGKHDIRLGDVVVSEASSASPAVIQFDRGKKHTKDEFELTGSVNKPPPLLSAMVKKLKAQHEQEGNYIPQLISDMLRRYPSMQAKYSSPGAENDQLFHSHYVHQDAGNTCQSCDSSIIVNRPPRPDDLVVVHYGTIGSSNAVLRDAQERDQLAERLNILCVEMEAAGLADHLPCLVIKGICDYADSHKNKAWQPYAAATAAAYAKDLLRIIPSSVGEPLGQTLVESPASEHIAQVDPNSSTSKSDAVTKVLMDSLTFDRMDARLRNISQALAQTCKWLITHQQFKDWKDREKVHEHYGFLWIKGKPGSGKSTILKTLLTWEKKSRIKQDVVSYFFNARAHRLLEKSTLGLYRSLTHQLLLACPHLQTDFFTHFSSKELDGVVDDWTCCELTEWWINIVQHQLHRPLVVLIDALDEGDEGDIRQLISFLEDIASMASSSNNQLRICLSSRHYPHITIRKGVSLTLEDQQGHDEDIRKYVSQKLTDDQSAAMEDLKKQVCEKSSGVFLWVVLVVPILNEAYDRGHNVSAASMLHCLRDIPLELDDLFTRILARGTENLDDCLTLLQWVLFTGQPLSLHELYIAVGIWSHSPRFDEKNKDPKRILRCILDTSKGLTEISKSEPHVVQFIHETVRDFLKTRGLAQIDLRLADSTEGLSHDKLKTSCMLYIRKCSEGIPSSRLMDKGECERRKKKLTFAYPFSEYAAKHMFHHSDTAEGTGVDQKPFLTGPQDEYLNLKDWVRVRNIFRPFKTQRYTSKAPLLYVLAENGLENLTRLLLAEGADDYVSSERYGTALQAACVSEHERIVRLLLSAGSEVNEESGEHEQALFAAIHVKNYSIVRLLTEHGANPPTNLVEARLFRAVARGDLLALEYLLKSGASVDCRNARDQTLLFYACSRTGKNAVSIVECLINKGADTRQPHLLQSTLTRNESAAVFKLLLTYGVDLNNLTTLTRTLVEHHCVLHIELLLESSSYVDIRAKISEELLKHAVSSIKYVDILMLLLQYGVDVNARCDRYPNALHYAVRQSSHKSFMIKTLTPYIEDINTRDDDDCTILQAAINIWHPLDASLIELLIQHGVDVNARCGRFSNALHYVLRESPYNPFSVAKTLIPHIEDINIRVDSDLTVLQVAIDTGHLSVVKLLIESGVNVNEWTRDGTALHNAVLQNNLGMVKLLIEIGADLNAVCNSYHYPGLFIRYPRTALDLAIVNDKEEIARVLIKTGADNLGNAEYVKKLITYWYSRKDTEMAHYLEGLLPRRCPSTSS